MPVSIVWFRRDLRLADNPALDAALAQSREILPLFIIDPHLWQGKRYSQTRSAFMIENLKSLRTCLRSIGSDLIIRRGLPAEVFQQLCEEFQVSTVYAESDITPYARERDRFIAARFPLRLIGNVMHHPPEDLLTSTGTPYKVFTAFLRRWKQLPSLSPSDLIPRPSIIQTPRGIPSDPLPEIPIGSLPDPGLPAGEQAAQAQLSEFTTGMNPQVYRYSQFRDRPDLDLTSHLSPYLHFGLISTRQTIASAYRAIEHASSQQGKQSAESWLNELIWRDFYRYILYHYPEALIQPFRLQYQHLQWSNDCQDFEAWKYGRTGFPFIDAAMRQLLNTGWMHNRSRMVTASFLVKNLLCDWRWGETWFMQNLLDGDSASNNGGWQWVAGTGTDAVPYFRIFNPITQSQKFDPEGSYIKRWVPELINLPLEFIHTPWKMSLQEQATFGCKMGKDYPFPIINLPYSRQRALEVFKRANPEKT